MCGRYTLTKFSEDDAEQFGLPNAPSVPPLYNVAPGQEVWTVRAAEGGGRNALLSQWGLVPSWTKDLKTARRPINARSETAAEKPSFRSALQQRRCLVPADGFYEWQKRGGEKVPHYIQLSSETVFAFAAIWEAWKGPSGESIDSCVILTTEPNQMLSAIHHRMPVILKPENYDRWLDSQIKDGADVADLLRPYPAEDMKARAVGKYVNSPRNNDERCTMREEGLGNATGQLL